MKPASLYRLTCRRWIDEQNDPLRWLSPPDVHLLGDVETDASVRLCTGDIVLVLGV
jgi:hypothetical protein